MPSSSGAEPFPDESAHVWYVYALRQGLTDGQATDFAESIREAIDLCMERDPSVWSFRVWVCRFRKGSWNHRGFASQIRAAACCDGHANVGERHDRCCHRIRPGRNAPRFLCTSGLDFAPLSSRSSTRRPNSVLHVRRRSSVSIVIRLLIRDGWGQGSQHSARSLQA